MNAHINTFPGETSTISGKSSQMSPQYTVNNLVKYSVVEITHLKLYRIDD